MSVHVCMCVCERACGIIVFVNINRKSVFVFRLLLLRIGNRNVYVARYNEIINVCIVLSWILVVWPCGFVTLVIVFILCCRSTNKAFLYQIQMIQHPRTVLFSQAQAFTLTLACTLPNRLHPSSTHTQSQTQTPHMYVHST